MSTPVIIEIALNGETSKTRNPNVARESAEIAADAIACLDGGAAIVHTHIDDPFLSGDAAARRYAEGWRAVLDHHPDAILCPTLAAAPEAVMRAAHLGACAAAGARMAPLDPGSMNMPLSGGGADEARVLSYINTFDDIGTILAAMRRHDLGASLGIYEPGFLRAATGFERAGLMPPGSLAKLYFFGGRNAFDAAPCVGFGLDPSAAALDAYLGLLEGSAMPWAVAVIGGCVLESGMARRAIARGGHIRFGLEDYCGSGAPSNRELLARVVDLIRSMGRRPATPREAAAILGLR